MSTRASAAGNRKAFWILFAIVLVDMLGVGILIPVIPLLLADPNYPYYLGLPLAEGLIALGILNAIYPFGQFIATPILGQLSDRYGRKPVLVFSLLGTSLSYGIFAVGIITKNVPLLFASRALDGITGGNISVAQAAIADITTPANRAKSFGTIGAAFGIGFIIGPFLGGQLSNPELVSWFNATTPFWFAGLLAFANMLAVLFYFTESLARPRHISLTLGQSFTNIKEAFSERRRRGLFSSSFLFTSGFTFFTTFFGVYVIAKFDFTQSQIGNIFALVGICVALTQALAVGFLAKRFKAFTIVAVSLFGVAVTVLAFSLADAPWQLYAITLPNSLFIGLIMANLTGLISRTAGPDRQGEILGINASVQALAQTLPPLIAGVAAALNPGLPMFIASGFIALAGVTFLMFCRGEKDVPLPKAQPAA